MSYKFSDFRRAYSSEVRHIYFSAKLKFSFEVVFFKLTYTKFIFSTTSPLTFVWIFFLFIKIFFSLTTFETYMRFKKEKVEVLGVILHTQTCKLALKGGISCNRVLYVVTRHRYGSRGACPRSKSTIAKPYVFARQSRDRYTDATAFNHTFSVSGQ